MKAVRDLLRAHSTLTLATVSPEGDPAAADLYFVSDDLLNLYFLSEHGARHAQNIAHNPRVAATVHAQAWDWQAIQGVQLEGLCRPVSSPAGRAAALARYGRKFSFLQAFAGVLPRHTIFCITPDWIRWLDNSVAFGHKVLVMK